MVALRSLRHRLSRVLLRCARGLVRYPSLRAAGRKLWDLYWAVVFGLRFRLRGRLCEVDTRVGPMTVDLEDRGVGRTLYWYGVYEPAESDLLESSVHPGMTVYDVGANIGYHTLLFSRRVGPRGRVVAVEPVPANLRLLQQNVSRSVHGANVRVIRRALSDRPGEVSLTLDPDNAGMHHVASPADSQAERRVSVPATTLDLLVEELGVAPDLVKIDVEGAEGRVLAGAAGTLARQPRLRLLMELNPPALARLGTSPAELLARLRALGYDAYRVCGQGLEAADEAWLEALAGGREHANLLFARPPLR